MKKYKKLSEEDMLKYNAISKDERQSFKDRLKYGSNKKVVYRLTAANEYKTLEKYLGDMAAKGLMVTKISNVYITFKKCAPVDLDFNVGIFYKAPFGFKSDINEQEYKKTCIDSGWEFVYASDIFHVFCKEKGVDVTPIYTDAEEEYKTIKKVIMKTDFAFIILIVMYLFISGVNLMSFGYTDMYSNQRLFSKLWPLFILLIFLIRFLPPVKWLIVNKIKLNKGQDLVYPTENKRARKEFGILFILNIYIILFVMSFVIGKSNFSFGIGTILFFFVAVLVLIIMALLFERYIRRINTEPVTRMIMLAAFTLVGSYIFLGITLVTVLFSINNNEDISPKEEPSRYVLTLEQFGEITEVNHIYKIEEESIFLKRQKYVESIVKENDRDYSNYIRTETLDCYSQFVADYIYQDIIESEKRHLNHSFYNHESYNVNNYVYEIDIEGLDVDQIYIVFDPFDDDREEKAYQLIIIVAKRIMIIESSYNLLDKEIIKMYQETLDL